MKVYLAGPIFGYDDVGVIAWRREAKTDLEHRGLTVIDPALRDYRGTEQDEVVAKQIVAQDLADIEAADAILANAWSPSSGTSMEIFYAARCGKRVLVVVPNPNLVSPWIRAHADRICTSIGEAAIWLEAEARAR